MLVYGLLQQPCLFLEVGQHLHPETCPAVADVDNHMAYDMMLADDVCPFIGKKELSIVEMTSIAVSWIITKVINIILIIKNHAILAIRTFKFVSLNRITLT